LNVKVGEGHEKDAGRKEGRGVEKVNRLGGTDDSCTEGMAEERRGETVECVERKDSPCRAGAADGARDQIGFCGRICRSQMPNPT